MLLPNPTGGEALTRSFTISKTDVRPNQPRLEPDGAMSLMGFGCHIKAFGTATRWLHDLPSDPENQVLGGDSGTEVRVLAVDGDFCLDVMQKDSLVPPKILFLSAGIGITPMIAMLEGLKFARSQNLRYPVDAVLLHTSRTLAEIVERQRLEALAAETGTPPTRALRASGRTPRSAASGPSPAVASSWDKGGPAPVGTRAARAKRCWTRSCLTWRSTWSTSAGQRDSWTPLSRW